MRYRCVKCFLSLTPPTRPPRQVVLQTPSKSFGLTKSLSREQITCVSPLAATLMDLPASVANKRLTDWLSHLDATLTKNRGVGSAPLVRLVERLFVTSLLPYLLTSSFLLTRSHSS